ncbi:MAG: hypothetical protein JSR91_16820 [Proteobacteria bacterium]|nr:hypothetical protein [Pseudomonadota bacterium]
MVKAMIAPGIGPALLRCIDSVVVEETKADGDERTGIQVLKRALKAPARQIGENSAVDGGVVVARMLDGKGAYEFDAARKQYVDLVKQALSIPQRSYELPWRAASVLFLREATMTVTEEPKEGVVTREPDLAAL